MSHRRYLFPRRLTEGLIKSRPNRFVMMADVAGELKKCHCPSTGRIGSILFEDIPCLISACEGKGRKTGHTVEAFSLDDPGDKKKRWIGINQVKANRYIEHFLKAGRMSRMFRVEDLRKEVKVGDSRFDFLVNGRDLLEVKTPLEGIPCEGHAKYRPDIPPASHFERSFRQLRDSTRVISNGARSVLLICHIYDARPFKVPPPGTNNPKILDAVRDATAKGMESWQANLRIDEDGVGLRDYYKIKIC